MLFVLSISTKKPLGQFNEKYEFNFINLVLTSIKNSGIMILRHKLILCNMRSFYHVPILVMYLKKCIALF